MMRNKDAAGTSAAENIKASLVMNFTDVHEQMRIAVCCEIKAGFGIFYLSVLQARLVVVIYLLSV